MQLVSVLQLVVLTTIVFLFSGCRSSSQRQYANRDLAELTLSEFVNSESQEAFGNDNGFGKMHPKSDADPVVDSSARRALNQDSEGPGFQGSVAEPENVLFVGRPTVDEEISIDKVLDAVLNHYPEIDISWGKINSAIGNMNSKWGEFDTVLESHTINQPLGFYQTYRLGGGVRQPLFSGGEVYGGYRHGDGNFEPWYGERETNEGGEFKAGFAIPLLKDSVIDGRRADLFSAEYKVEQVESEVESRLLLVRRMAIQAYWDCVASSNAVAIQNRLLQLAEARVEQIKLRVEKGDLAEIANIDNDRFIAKRKNDLVKVKRVFEKAAIKLSIFFRDVNGNPTIASKDQFPKVFPESTRIGDQQLNDDISVAIRRRPELAALESKRQAMLIELGYAENSTLPKLDIKGFAGQDIGGQASKKGDKTPFEFQVGLIAEVPIQRRDATGKIQATQGKLAQLEGKLKLTSDKIRIEIQDAASAINAAFDQIALSETNVELAERSLALGKVSFDNGDIDLIALNIYESSLAAAQLQLLDAQLKYQLYRAAYENALRSFAFRR